MVVCVQQLILKNHMVVAYEKCVRKRMVGEFRNQLPTIITDILQAGALANLNSSIVYVQVETARNKLTGYNIQQLRCVDKLLVVLADCICDELKIPTYLGISTTFLHMDIQQQLQLSSAMEAIIDAIMCLR